MVRAETPDSESPATITKCASHSGQSAMPPVSEARDLKSKSQTAQEQGPIDL